MGPRVVVAGLGDTGVLVAIALARRFEVTAIGTKPALVSGQELGVRVSDPERWRRNYLVSLDRFARLDAVRTLQGRVDRVDPDRRLVHVALATGGAKIVPYDHLVIATGVTNGFWRNDRVQDRDTIDAEIDAVADQLAAAATVAVVGGGPTGSSSAANLARRHRGQEVHLFFGGDSPLPGYHPRTRRRVERELLDAGVHLHPGHRAVIPEGLAPDRLTTDPIAWSTGQAPFSADVVLWATGRVRPHSAFLPADMVDEHGFVRVDEHLEVPGHSGVFAVGDVAATDPHRSSARNWGFLVVARNVAAQAAGHPERMRRFRAPEHRWGSVLGLRDDGMLVFQPDGRAVRIPAWLAQPLLFDLYLRLGLYRGVRRDPAG